MIDNGLNKESSVLEAGCGVVTITILLSEYITKGRIDAFDISPEGVELSSKRVGKKENVFFSVSGIKEFNTSEKYDFILLADVLEHIPLEDQYLSLLNLSKFSNPETKLIINIPDPRMNNYLKKNFPEQLQIIDHSLFAEDILKLTNEVGFKLSVFERYSLHHREPDYNFMVFDKNTEYKKMNHLKRLEISFKKIKTRARLLKSLIKI
jgi:trans-aconitate 2-methyltransferase